MVSNDPDILAYLRSILMPNPRVRPDINDMIGRLNNLRSIFHRKIERKRLEEEERKRREEVERQEREEEEERKRVEEEERKRREAEEAKKKRESERENEVSLLDALYDGFEVEDVEVSLNLVGKQQQPTQTQTQQPATGP